MSKKSTLVYEKWDPDSMEFLMICISCNIPESVTYNTDAQWMQIIYSEFKPIRKHYLSKTGQRRVKDFNYYVAIRLDKIPSQDIIDELQNSPNYIDYISTPSGGSTWYFMVNPDMEGKIKNARDNK